MSEAGRYSLLRYRRRPAVSLHSASEMVLQWRAPGGSNSKSSLANRTDAYAVQSRDSTSVSGGDGDGDGDGDGGEDGDGDGDGGGGEDGDGDGDGGEDGDGDGDGGEDGDGDRDGGEDGDRDGGGGLPAGSVSSAARMVSCVGVELSGAWMASRSGDCRWLSERIA